MKSKRMSKKPVATHYTHWDELMADPVNAMPPAKITKHLTVLWEALASIERSQEPTIEDWRLIADVTNLTETLITHKTWPAVGGGVVEIADNGLMDAAQTALAAVINRVDKGLPMRLDAQGITAIRSVLEDYAQCIENITHRGMVRCHRMTEKKIKELLASPQKGGGKVYVL